VPKAWAVEKLSADMALSHGAALILQVKLPEVMSYEAAARSGDVDGVHDMRVGAKRLREAARVLRPALPETARKRVLGQVERLNDALGLVRDRDVLGMAFAAVRKRSSQTAVLEGLSRQLGSEREAYRKALGKLLRELRARGFAAFYAEVMGEMAQAPAEGQPTVAAFAAEAVSTRLADVLDNWAAARTPWDPIAFHRERIRVKKLKYALEPFVTVLPPELTPIYDQIAELQELMGLVHDCDVQAGVLADWVGGAGGAPGYSLAEEDIAARRRRACIELRMLLERMAAADWSARLGALLDGFEVVRV
jgi:CHAD domain-containing protein